MSFLISVAKFVLLPSHAILILLIIGLSFLFLKLTKRCGIIFMGFGISLLLLFTNGPFSYWLLGTLEYRYPPFKSHTTGYGFGYIAVLAGYAANDHTFPLSSRVNDATIFRIVEAVQLWKKYPVTTILIAGPDEGAIVMAELMEALGVKSGKIKRLPPSSDTRENIHTISKVVSEAPFILVTSAGHMPRAVFLCRQADLNPIPAPTDYITSPYILTASWLPGHRYLKCSDLAIHELTAILYYKYFKLSSL